MMYLTMPYVGYLRLERLEQSMSRLTLCLLSLLIQFDSLPTVTPRQSRYSTNLSASHPLPDQLPHCSLTHSNYSVSSCSTLPHPNLSDYPYSLPSPTPPASSPSPRRAYPSRSSHPLPSIAGPRWAPGTD